MARMSAGHLASQGGSFEPQRKFDFEVQIFGIPGSNVVTLSVASFTPPSYASEVIELPYLNQVVKVAGQTKASQGTLMCRDFVDQQTFSNLMQWRKQVLDTSTHNIGRAATYKKKGDVVLIAPDQAGERRVKMTGLWPVEVKPGQVDHAAGNAIYEVEVVLSCDSVESDLG